MESLQNLEENLNLTPRKAFAAFACTSLLLTFVVLLAVALRRKGCFSKKGSAIHQEPRANETTLRCSLIRALRWSGPTGREASNVGWQSHNSTSAVWKKPILMGEKCEFPRFSGLVLYDERGAPCREFRGEVELPAASSVRVTTLGDLLGSFKPSC